MSGKAQCGFNFTPSKDLLKLLFKPVISAEKTLFKGLNVDPKDAEKVKIVFNDLDTDKKGFLIATDFVNLVDCLDPNLTQQERTTYANKLTDTFDKNKDGNVSWADWEEAAKLAAE